MAETLVELIARIKADATELKQGLSESEKAVDDTGKSLERKFSDWADKFSKQLRIVGAAFTVIGVAGMKMVDTSKELNAQLGATGITIGASTKEMKDLALATTDVTFPLQSVVKTFELLAKAGVKNQMEIQASAKAFDTLADATGTSAEVVADLLLPAFKLFGKAIPTTTKELDKFTWMTKNTLVDLSDFGTLLTRMSPYMDQLNMSMDDAILTLAALGEQGIVGTAATLKLRTAITQAASSGEDLNTILGLSPEIIGKYRMEMEGAVGITDQYATQLNTQYTLLDKVKQKFSEITLSASGFLEPLEPLLATMTALGPAMLFLSTSMGIATAKWIIHTTAIVAHTVAIIALSVATVFQTAAQWALNIAMYANPIGIVILAIIALVAIGIALYKNWDKIIEKAHEIWGNMTNFFQSTWVKITGFFSGARDTIVKIWDTTLVFFKSIPGKIGEAFSVIKDIILSPFRAAWQGIESGINWLIKMLNKISFTVPDWVPQIGGKFFGINISEVSLPKFDKGGIVPGAIGQPQLAMVHGGETIIPANESMGNIVVNFSQPVFFEREDTMNRFVDMIRKGIQRQDRLRFGGAYSGS